MTRGKRTVRASEIGSFVYCQRSWWYRRQGETPINRDQLTDGTQYHESHAGHARMIRNLQSVSWLALLIAITFLTIYISIQIFP